MERDTFHEQTGRLKAELAHAEISVRRQREFLGVSRSGLYYELAGESEENLMSRAQQN